MKEIERAIYTLKNDYDLKKLYSEYYSIQQAIDIAISALEKQLNGGWIPVKDRLPTIRECIENEYRFIGTDGNRRYQVWFDYEEDYFEKSECKGLNLKKDKCVIAWQLLPQAYEVNNNFECRYMCVGGTFCFRDEEINMLNGNECSSCEINNSCEYCAWKISHQENCNNCSVLEVENE